MKDVAMIENPTKQDLVELIGKEAGVCVSILMRTHESGRETTQNAIRFKNLISDAIKQVQDKEPALREQLIKLAELEHDDRFWQHQGSGLAIFVCKDFQQRFKVNHDLQEAVYVGEQFLIRPLAGAACGTDTIRALALSWERARWFACDGHTAREIQNDSFPALKDDLIAESDAEAQLQFRTQGPQGGQGGRSQAMFYGHGKGEDTIQAERGLYLTRVGKLVADAVYNTQHKFVLVATDEVAGHFSSIRELEIDRIVHMSPDSVDGEELRAKIVEASHALMTESGKDWQQRLGSALAANQGSSDIGEILREACSGRVGTLLVGDSHQLRGDFNRAEQKVAVDVDGQTDLINLAVRETLQAGGNVARLPAASKSSESIAAIYRY